MERLYTIAILFLVLVSSCKGEGEKADTDLRDVKTVETSEAEATFEDDEDMEIDEDDLSGLGGLFGIDMDSLVGGSDEDGDLGGLFAQMLGEVTMPRDQLIPSDIDSLKSLIKKYPELRTKKAITITNTNVTVDFSELVQIVSKMDASNQKTFNATLPTILEPSSSKTAPGDHPFAGTFLEESLKEISGGSAQERYKSKQLYQQLEGATPEDARKIVAEHYGIKPEEADLLISLKKDTSIMDEKQARALADPKYSAEIEAALQKPNTSPEFKNIIAERKKTQKREADRFLRKSSRAREQFYKLNPSWYADKENQSGNTYTDSRRKHIYLPLGARSFADEVVDFDPGKGGKYPKGALHEPEIPAGVIRWSGARPEICNIGLKGVLVLQFIDNAITDVNGPDLYVFEVGAIEPTLLELSQDGSNWLEVGRIEGGTAMVDIHDYVKPGETFTYVRLTDLNTVSGVPGADVDAVAAIGGALRLNLDSSVLFEFGKYNLKPEAEAALTELIPQINTLGQGTIVVEGHTDNVGNQAANNKLSKQRAESVRTALKTLMKGTANNFTWKVKGHGDSQPVVPNDSDENRQRNRRVELLIIPE